MNTIGLLIEHVSSQLNDQQQNKEYLRWNRSTLLDYYYQALNALRSYRIDAFTGPETLTLAPGAKQTVVGYSEIKSVDANADGSPAHTGDVAVLKAFSAYNTCPPKLQTKNGKVIYAVKSVGIDRNDPSTFYVSPPVPPGMVATVQATVVRNVRNYTLADWDKPHDFDMKYVNQVVDFMQGRAYELDIESVTSKQDAARFFSRFFQSLGINYKMDSASNSGYYRGQVGTGDSRAAAT